VNQPWKGQDMPRHSMGRALDALLGPKDPPIPTLSDAGLSWGKQVADPGGLSGVGLIQAMLQADGVAALRLGPSGLTYVDGSDTYVLDERPANVRVLEANKVLEVMGADFAQEHQATFTELAHGYTCFMAGCSATGNTKGEASIRAWLLHQASKGKGPMTGRDQKEHECTCPSEPVDLTVAKRVLGELAKQDGDLGAAYWQSVLNLLCYASQMHSELQAAAARSCAGESTSDLTDWT
jgi:hypothetical protein